MGRDRAQTGTEERPMGRDRAKKLKRAVSESASSTTCLEVLQEIGRHLRNVRRSSQGN
jgi:hypothetical protein